MVFFITDDHIDVELIIIYSRRHESSEAEYDYSCEPKHARDLLGAFDGLIENGAQSQDEKVLGQDDQRLTVKHEVVPFVEIVGPAQAIQCSLQEFETNSNLRQV